MKRDKMKALQLKLTELEKTLAKQENPDLLAEILKVKAELEISSLAAEQGAQIRSRIKFIEQGEKNTAYFLALEKTNASSNTITSIITENGHKLTEQNDILSQQTNFYRNLYQEDSTLLNTTDTDIYDFLGQNCTPTNPGRRRQRFLRRPNNRTGNNRSTQSNAKRLTARLRWPHN